MLQPASFQNLHHEETYRRVRLLLVTLSLAYPVGDALHYVQAAGGEQGVA